MATVRAVHLQVRHAPTRLRSIPRHCTQARGFALAFLGVLATALGGCRIGYETGEAESAGQGGRTGSGGNGGSAVHTLGSAGTGSGVSPVALQGGTAGTFSTIDLAGASDVAALGGISGTSSTTALGGTSGMSGTAASGGSSGTSGSAASGGISGASGNNGFGGSSGMSGSAASGGISGASGNNGFGGTSGTTTFGGTSGSSGASGTSASAGTSGAIATGCSLQAFSSTTYAVCTTNEAFDAAAATCASMSMQLVRIDSSEENDWVSTLVANGWVGGSDRTTEGEWRWADNTLFWLGDQSGAPVNGLYSAWNSTDPSATPAIADCALFVRNSSTWVAVGCTGRYPFVCEAY